MLIINKRINSKNEDIKDKANLLLESGGYQNNLEFSHVMDKDMWVITALKESFKSTTGYVAELFIIWVMILGLNLQ